MANESGTAVTFVKEVLSFCELVKRVTFFAVLDKATQDNTVVDAYVRGYREALASGADWILEIDGGFSHQPKDILQFSHTWRRGMTVCSEAGSWRAARSATARLNGGW